VAINDVGCFGIKVRTDTAKFTNMRITGFVVVGFVGFKQ